MMGLHRMHQKKPRCDWKIFFLICLALMVLPICSHAEKSDIEKPPVSGICQSSIQSIQVMQSNLAQPSQLPTSGWENVKSLPDYWDRRWKNNRDSAWYKIQWRYQCANTFSAPVTLVINRINMAGEIYLNNEFFWKDQSTTEPLSRGWHNPRYWVIPASSLKQGDNTLWIRVIGTSTQKSGLGLVSVGEHAQMIKIYDHANLETKVLPTLSIFLNLVIGLFCLIVWLFNLHDKSFKWFAMVSFAWVLYVALTMLQEPIFSLTSQTTDRISGIVFSFYTFFGCLAAWRFANKRFQKIEWVFTIFCLFTTLVICFAPTQYLPKVLNLFFLIGVLIFLAKCLSYPFIAYHSRVKESYILAVQYLLFIPVVINDAMYMITLKGQILSPYTSLASAFVVAFLLALRLSSNSKRIAQFNKTLKESIIQAKQELSISLNNQHQLALENVKLQERINLSHDLHDGLGGSISRSLIMLENNENFQRNQMLSILKLLRSDLRQTIDLGSSLDTKAPTTPIVWASHLRHRFVQIFEEMDITSKWNLAEKWTTQPNALQCMTLARVTEEALTNIIKHSHANRVDISLTENEHFLILEISDNGIGFDPQHVETGLHIGLHSMQIRVQRLNGLFEIHSDAQLTTLKISLPLNTENTAQKNQSES